jgi:modification methylase
MEEEENLLCENEEETEFEKRFLNKIHCGDCLELMKAMPEKCVDLIVTSPSYNLKNSSGNGISINTKTGKWAGAALQKGYSHYDDKMPHDLYVKWQNNCLKEMFRLLKDDGAIFTTTREEFKMDFYKIETTF